ncbi:hypothetical protein MED297_19252 [Reinekea sp. MED297]|uniref:Uncharacterized protein n=1 Tax=Reinekea blandensis MED297 TaxID=314283 RepID=A4B8V5_9GAMM|nr:hypothetical protein MED297_19252 [Reinekea sp. MED297] [Reinekea blandensis MED297]
MVIKMLSDSRIPIQNSIQIEKFGRLAVKSEDILELSVSHLTDFRRSQGFDLNRQSNSPFVGLIPPSSA